MTTATGGVMLYRRQNAGPSWFMCLQFWHVRKMSEGPKSVSQLLSSCDKAAEAGADPAPSRITNLEDIVEDLRILAISPYADRLGHFQFIDQWQGRVHSQRRFQVDPSAPPSMRLVLDRVAMMLQADPLGEASNPAVVRNFQ